MNNEKTVLRESYMIIVTGRISVDPASVEELLGDLRAGIDRSLKEDGCQFYSFAMEDAAAGHILTLQIWRDEEALAAHLAAPGIGDLVGKWDGRYNVGTKFYDVTNERAVGVWNNPALGEMIRESRK